MGKPSIARDTRDDERDVVAIELARRRVHSGRTGPLSHAEREALRQVALPETA